MKNKSAELDMDFIGGERPLTKADEVAISNFIRAEKAKGTRKHSTKRRTVKPTRRNVIA